MKVAIERPHRTGGHGAPPNGAHVRSYASIDDYVGDDPVLRRTGSNPYKVGGWEEDPEQAGGMLHSMLEPKWHRSHLVKMSSNIPPPPNHT